MLEPISCRIGQCCTTLLRIMTLPYYFPPHSCNCHQYLSVVPVRAILQKWQYLKSIFSEIAVNYSAKNCRTVVFSRFGMNWLGIGIRSNVECPSLSTAVFDVLTWVFSWWLLANLNTVREMYFGLSTDSRLDICWTDSRLDIRCTDSRIDICWTDSRLDIRCTDSRLDTRCTDSRLDTRWTDSRLDIRCTDSRLDIRCTDSRLEIRYTDSRLDIRCTAT